jgi:very-short-patch-repair endonuclease
MKLFLLVVVLFAIAIPAALYLKKLEKKADGSVYAAKPLFSPAERSFLGVMDSVLPKERRIFAKVRLVDLVQPKGGLSKEARQSALNRISAKHVDFVLCDGGSLAVLAVVELDDSSHGAAKRIVRDAFVDECLKAAGISIVRIPAKASYRTEDLRPVLAAIGAEPSASQQGSLAQG